MAKVRERPKDQGGATSGRDVRRAGSDPRVQTPRVRLHRSSQTQPRPSHVKKDSSLSSFVVSSVVKTPIDSRKRKPTIRATSKR